MKITSEAVKKQIPLVIILAFALLLRIWGMSFGLPDISHGDEPEVINHAVRFGTGDLNPHRFQYGSLFQYLLFAAYGLYFLVGYVAGFFSSIDQFALGFISDPTVFYLIARGFSALFGTATVGLAYVLGRRVQGRQTGLLAALFLACSREHVIHSHYATVDITLTFFVSLSVVWCIRVCECGRMRDYILAGLCAGFALATKVSGVFACVALLSAHILSGRQVLWKKPFSGRLWAACAAVIAGHFAACPYFYIDAAAAFSEVFALRDMHAASQSTLFPYLLHLAGDFTGVPLGALCLAGGALVLVAGTKKEWVMWCTAAAIISFASLHRYVEAKYVLFGFPLLCVFGARFFYLCCRRIQKPVYYWLAVFVAVAHPVYSSMVWNNSRTEISIGREARLWVETSIHAGSKILLDNVGNAGPQLCNNHENLQKQYERARRHGLLKAEQLRLKLMAGCSPSYDITYIDCSAGFRKDDYERYRLWQDLESPGLGAGYYCCKGYKYVIITQRYFKDFEEGFVRIKEFRQGKKAIRVYRVECNSGL